MAADDVEAVDAVLDASRALVAISARSIAAVDDAVDPVGVRVLVFVAEHEAVSLREVAEALDVHVSTASRLCDRLVVDGLLDRRDDPADRRQLALRLTAAGTRVVGRVLDRRRQAVSAVLDRMSGAERGRLSAALHAFTAAAGDAAGRDLWALGWPR